MFYNGYEIIKNINLVEKKLTKMCRSKKNRIKNKWLKNSKNYSYAPKKSLYVDQTRRCIFGHPITIDTYLKMYDIKLKETIHPYVNNHLNGMPYHWS